MRERPSSLTVHSPAMASSSACRRETSVSHGQAELVPAPATDAHALLLVEVQQALRAVAVAEDEEGPAAALGLDALAQLGGRGGVGLKWGRHVDCQGYPG